MPQPTQDPHSPAAVDPERSAPRNPFDAADGYSGQEYTPERQDRQAAEEDAAVQPPRSADDSDRDLPPDAGRAAGFDRATGEVYGSGAGAGGGNQGEDYETNPKGGGGTPRTGVEQAEER